MDSEEEGISADIIEDEEEEEEIGVDDGGKVFPTVDRVFKETEVVDEDDFHFEVITADNIVHHMVQCIKDVNTAVQPYASISQKMAEMMQQNMSWIEVQFLKRAVDVLCQCREVLMYTYIFAFYLLRNNQSLIFEDNQKDLENATEQLSEYLERDITSEILVGIKRKVQDKTRYCESRRQVVLDHVHEGYDKDLWKYQETV